MKNIKLRKTNTLCDAWQVDCERLMVDRSEGPQALAWGVGGSMVIVGGCRRDCG